VLASIPAPPFNAIGPFRLYGLLIALGVLAAVWLGQRRFAARGGDPEEISNLALIAVPAGLVGARLYHVITDYQRLYCGPPKCEKSLWPDALQL
jgi:prolipoprotein diacylglyceryltransferase